MNTIYINYYSWFSVGNIISCFRKKSLIDTEHKGTMIIINVGNCLPFDKA